MAVNKKNDCLDQHLLLIAFGGFVLLRIIISNIYMGDNRSLHAVFAFIQ